MKKNDLPNKLSNLLFYLSAFLFFIAFNFKDSRTSGWYQQFLPTGLPNFQVSDVFFLDSLRGWLVSGNTNPNDSSGYILKTTNGGDNWMVLHGEVRDFTRVKFLNVNTGFVCGGYSTGARLYKTTNGGNNWFALNIPGGGQIIFDDMAVLSEDTIWLAAHESLVGGAFLTTNGGVSWTQKFSGGTENPNKIYFYNSRIGFIKNINNSSSLKKTTNGGNNWFATVNEGFWDMYFSDSLTGWRVNGYVKKTTDGGLSWVQQTLPQGINGQTIFDEVASLSKFSKDTIWASNAVVVFPNIQTRGILFRTTNGGINWLYQIPDTSFGITRYRFIQFINKNIGWAYTGAIHTTNGGDTTFLSSINQISNLVPNEYTLYQNYPNPFNQVTNVKFQMLKHDFVEIKVFDISGRLVKILLSENFKSGVYETKFDAGSLSSGVYFYSLFVDGVRVDTKKAVLIK